MPLIPLLDIVAVVWFFALWIGYDRFAAERPDNTVSLLGATNRMRRSWMVEVMLRDNRITDAAILANLSSSPTFFASTTMIVIGGLFALLGVNEKAVEMIYELPFAKRASTLVWDVKVILLIGIFIYAFFRFTWALRQFNFVSIMVGAARDREFNLQDVAHREAYAAKAGKLVAVAGETFNDGLRAYYFALAASAWFLQPLFFMGATLAVVAILYQREFHSRTLKILAGTE
jgi:uncharacterized membrane protein